MKLAQRIERLEAASPEAEYWHWVERLAEEWRMLAEPVFQGLQAIHDRIERRGLDAELRRKARESGQGASAAGAAVVEGRPRRGPGLAAHDARRPGRDSEGAAVRP